MIDDPHVLQDYFEKLANTYDSLTPLEKIPKELRNKIEELLTGWSDAYAVQDWGSASLYRAQKVPWTVEARDHWNKIYQQTQKLVNQAKVIPGMIVAAKPIEEKPKGPVIQAGMVPITGAPPPWLLIVGAAGLLFWFARTLAKR